MKIPKWKKYKYLVASPHRQIGVKLKKRPCLNCDEIFESKGKFNRLCTDCKRREMNYEPDLRLAL